MSSLKNIEIKVNHHPSGNLTLEERNVGDPNWTQFIGTDLWANSDALSFYRAAIKKLADYVNQGIAVKNIILPSSLFE